MEDKINKKFSSLRHTHKGPYGVLFKCRGCGEAFRAYAGQDRCPKCRGFVFMPGERIPYAQTVAECTLEGHTALAWEALARPSNTLERVRKYHRWRRGKTKWRRIADEQKKTFLWPTTPHVCRPPICCGQILTRMWFPEDIRG